MAETVECRNCGAVYEVTYTKIIFRDKDTADCQVCGTQIDSWNGSNLPSHRLMSRPPEGAPEDGLDG